MSAKICKVVKLENCIRRDKDITVAGVRFYFGIGHQIYFYRNNTFSFVTGNPYSSEFAINVPIHQNKTTTTENFHALHV